MRCRIKVLSDCMTQEIYPQISGACQDGRHKTCAWNKCTCNCHSPAKDEGDWQKELIEVFHDAYDNAEAGRLIPFIRRLIQRAEARGHISNKNYIAVIADERAAAFQKGRAAERERLIKLCEGMKRKENSYYDTPYSSYSDETYQNDGYNNALSHVLAALQDGTTTV